VAAKQEEETSPREDGGFSPVPLIDRPSSGDLVAIHSHYHLANDKGLAVVDIFRVLKGKVVEHWDVVQAVPETAANDNTMF
jgi:predicted SnoaL-like aldol condensation-catalyzing enzyme